MKWTRFDRKFIQVIQQKTNEYLTIPCHKVLRDALLAVMPEKKDGYVLATRLGDRFTNEGLSNAFRRLLKKIGAKGYSIHGLRKNAAAKLAEVGCTELQIMAVTGHRSLAMVVKYTKLRTKNAARLPQSRSGNKPKRKGLWPSKCQPLERRGPKMLPTPLILHQDSNSVRIPV
jgi:integrase